MPSPPSTHADAPLTVEVWSDVVCPWCYIGKRRLERALAELAGEVSVRVTYRPYQLDPTASPGAAEPVLAAYAKKFGGPERAQALIDHVTETAAGDGIAFRMDRALRANTLLAHRLIWLAGRPASPAAQPVMKERLLQAYFVDGLDIGDPAVLARCAAGVRFDRDVVADFLDSDVGVAEVRADLEAAAELGVTAVPTFVVNGQWAIPGAQDTDTFVNVLRRLHERIRLDATTSGDDSCRI